MISQIAQVMCAMVGNAEHGVHTCRGDSGTAHELCM